MPISISAAVSEDVRCILRGIEILARENAYENYDKNRNTSSDETDIERMRTLKRNKSAYVSRHSRKNYEILLEKHLRRIEGERDEYKQEIAMLNKQIALLRNCVAGT